MKRELVFESSGLDEELIKVTEQAEKQHQDNKKLKKNFCLMKQPKSARGMVKVAKYYPGKPQANSVGFSNILIHTDAKPLGGDLSPYVLSNEHGQLLENIWQFSKLYAKVTTQKIPISRWQPNLIIWEHNAEDLVNEQGTPTKSYWQWREKGMNNKFAVRYPNGFNGRHQCLCSLMGDENKYERLDYIEARKRIYCGEYIRLAPKTAHFKKLMDLLDQGVNIQILEVDGPDPELTFSPYDRITKKDPGLLIDEEVIRMLVNDPRKPFGHGYAIASLLLNGETWMI